MGDPGAVVDLIREEGWLGIAVAFLVYGGGAFLLGVVKDWRRRRAERPTPEDATLKRADQSMLTMVKAHDEIAKDLDRERGSRSQERLEHAQEIAAERVENTRLRRALAEEEARNLEREAAMHERIERLEDRLRQLLTEVTELKRRSGNGHPEH